MAHKIPTGVVLVCGEATGGDIKEVKSILGLRISSVSGVGEKSYALTDTDAYDVDTGEHLGLSNPIALYSGIQNYVALTRSGELYSWGSGEYGELGLGNKYTEVNVPTKISHQSSFSSISCGDNHTSAVDTHGNLYAWGQNFDKQLGIYKKSQAALPSHTVVEEMMMVPKFVPFSLNRPIKSIACGSRFTVAVTVDGEVWSWGAGESGQLGSGRCTHRDQPALAVSKDITTERFIVASCGFGHAIAVTETGKAYSWGLNTKGQLGLGDFKTRHTPTELELPNGHAMAKVFADGSSSACITEQGQLFTWGCGIHHRLMLNNDCANVVTPTAVTKVAGNVIETFSFAKKQSLLLILTRVLKVSPLSGPQKTFSCLQLHGCGFWDSDSIVVRFTKKNEDGAMPRSSHGKFVRDGVLSCRPPKLSDIGTYEVSVALNGQDFSADVSDIEIYPDPIVNSLVSPQLVDGRGDNGEVDIVLNCSRLGLQAKKSGVFVRLYDQLDESKEPIICEGYIETPDKRKKYNDDEDIDDVSSKFSSLENVKAESAAPGEEEQIVICRDVDLSPLMVTTDEKQCCILRAQVSNNVQDFSEPSPEKLICHWFSPSTITPSCSPFAGQREAIVKGTGLIPSTHAQLEAVIAITIDAKNISGSYDEDDSVVLEVAAPVRSDRWDDLSYTVPSLKEFFEEEDFVMPKNQDVFNASVNFRIVGGELLASNAFVFRYYRPRPVDIFPQAIRRSGGTLLKLTGKGVHFYSDAAKILFVDRESNSAESIVFDEFSEAEDGALCIQCTSPSLIGEKEDDASDGGAEESVSDAYIGLLLDGVTQPRDDELTKIKVFTEVIIPSESFPKAIVTMGTPVTVPAHGLVDSGLCVIRIRSTDGKFIEVDGTLDPELTSFSFTVPDVHSLLPEGTTKSQNFYFVDICLDGITYDSTRAAELQIKTT